MNSTKLKPIFRSVTVKSEPAIVSQIGRLFASHRATRGFKIEDREIAECHFFVLIDEDDSILAAASAQVDESDATMFRLLNLIVVPCYRGIGIGSRFLNQVESEAKAILENTAITSKNLRIRVFPGYGSAPFYLRNGYEAEDFLLFKAL